MWGAKGALISKGQSSESCGLCPGTDLGRLRLWVPESLSGALSPLICPSFLSCELWWVGSCPLRIKALQMHCLASGRKQ